MAISLKRAEGLVVAGKKLTPKVRQYLRGRIKRERKKSLDCARENIQRQEKKWRIISRLESVLEMDKKNKT